MKKSLAILWAMSAIASVFLTSCSFGGSHKGGLSVRTGSTLSVSAAASLKDALEEIKKEYLIDVKELENTKELKINLNFGASGTLQKQIEEGAPVDIFISAGKSQMEQLDKKGLLEPGTNSDLLKNELVVIVPAKDRNKIQSLDDLLQVNGKIAVGETASVPVGQYSKQALEYYKLWDKLVHKFVYANDVKQIAAYVENGEVEAGLVYKSDTLTLKNSSTEFQFPSESHQPIVYPVAVTKESKNKSEALKFVEYLKGEKARKIFQKYGFLV